MFMDHVRALVRLVTSEACLIWQGAKANGYPAVWDSEKAQPVYVARQAWEIVNGPIPDGCYISRMCDHMECINPAHLIARRPGARK